LVLERFLAGVFGAPELFIRLLDDAGGVDGDGVRLWTRPRRNLAVSFCTSSRIPGALALLIFFYEEFISFILQLDDVDGIIQSYNQCEPA